MSWRRWRRSRRPGDTPAGRRDLEPRDLNDRSVHTPGTYIDSWFNMPGAQPDDDDDHRPTVSELHGRA